jgi:hypothetical protein
VGVMTEVMRRTVTMKTIGRYDSWSCADADCVACLVRGGFTGDICAYV